MGYLTSLWVFDPHHLTCLVMCITSSCDGTQQTSIPAGLLRGNIQFQKAVWVRISAFLTFSCYFLVNGKKRNATASANSVTSEDYVYDGDDCGFFTFLIIWEKSGECIDVKCMIAVGNDTLKTAVTYEWRIWSLYFFCLNVGQVKSSYGLVTDYCLFIDGIYNSRI